jgi:hypothetical protein
MKWWLPIACGLVLPLAACHHIREKQLIGDWLSGCSIDICTITSLKADQTYCDKFDEKDIVEPSVCGTWRLENDQLVLHITWTASAVKPPMLGKELHFTISDFGSDSFVATLAGDEKWNFRWKRVH